MHGCRGAVWTRLCWRRQTVWVEKAALFEGTLYLILCIWKVRLSLSCRDEAALAAAVDAVKARIPTLAPSAPVPDV